MYQNSGPQAAFVSRSISMGVAQHCLTCIDNIPTLTVRATVLHSDSIVFAGAELN